MPNNLTSPAAMASGDGQAAPGPSNALVAPPPGPSPSGPATPAAMPTAPAAPQKSIHINEVKDLMHKQAMIDRKLRGLLKDGGPVKRKQVIDMATGLVADNVMSAQAMAGYLADLPEDPMKVREWAAAHAKTVEMGLDHLLTMVDGANAPLPEPGMMQ